MRRKIWIIFWMNLQMNFWVCISWSRLYLKRIFVSLHFHWFRNWGYVDSCYKKYHGQYCSDCCPLIHYIDWLVQSKHLNTRTLLTLLMYLYSLYLVEGGKCIADTVKSVNNKCRLNWRMQAPLIFRISSTTKETICSQ